VERDYVVALFKFGQKGYMERLVSDGLLYMNTLEYFAGVEADPARGDSNEGVEKTWPARESRVFMKKHIENRWEELGPLVGPLQFRRADSLALNVYCMYGLRASTASSLVHPRNFAFGDTFVLFRDGAEFLRRAQRAALDVGRTMESGIVEYVDEPPTED
jgi:hypothetical protein